MSKNDIIKRQSSVEECGKTRLKKEVQRNGTSRLVVRVKFEVKTFISDKFIF